MLNLGGYNCPVWTYSPAIQDGACGKLYNYCNLPNEWIVTFELDKKDYSNLYPCFWKNLWGNERQCLTTFPNTEKRVKNMACSRIFLMFETHSNSVLSEGWCENSQSSDTFEGQPEVQKELRTLGCLSGVKNYAVSLSFGEFSLKMSTAHAFAVCCMVLSQQKHDRK